MGELADVLTGEAKKSEVIQDCLEIIDLEVQDKRGLSGMAVKAGYRAVKGIRPGFLKKVVHDLLPEFARAIEPTYEKAKSSGRPVRQYMADHRDQVADSLLAVTDERARRTKSGIVKATYDRLRGTAKQNVEAAVPRLGGLVEKHSEGLS